LYERRRSGGEGVPVDGKEEKSNNNNNNITAYDGGSRKKEEDDWMRSWFDEQTTINRSNG
jgi:hypothetical protein